MTSEAAYRNEFRNNIMGRTPAGKRKPNGTDFWWDDVIGQTNNCWVDNLGKLNTEASDEVSRQVRVLSRHPLPPTSQPGDALNDPQPAGVSDDPNPR